MVLANSDANPENSANRLDKDTTPLSHFCWQPQRPSIFQNFQIVFIMLLFTFGIIFMSNLSRFYMYGNSGRRSISWVHYSRAFSAWYWLETHLILENLCLFTFISIKRIFTLTFMILGAKSHQLFSARQFGGAFAVPGSVTLLSGVPTAARLKGGRRINILLWNCQH